MIRSFPRRAALNLGLLAVLSQAMGVSAADSNKPSQSVTTVTARQLEALPSARMTLEPKALEILKGACERLAAAKSLSFTAVVTHESPSRLGTPLAYTTKSEVLLQRPDKLRVITPADGTATEFYYDGKTMTAFAPTENLVATAPAPPTIDAALEAAYKNAAIYFPFTDLIVSNPYKDLTDGLVVAFPMGQSRVVGGTTTEMIAYGTKDLFVQIWIGTEDKLPRLARAVYLNDKAALRHQVEFTNWQLDPAVPADAFTSARAAGATPIPFAHPAAPLPSAQRPPADNGQPTSGVNRK